MTQTCRCFNDAGIQVASAALDELRAHPDRELPSALLDDETLSEAVGGSLRVPSSGLSNRWKLGAWLFGELDAAEKVDRSVLHRTGFWTWLAFFLFSVIRPLGKRVGEDARYILNGDDYRKRYRHLVAGPYYVFSAHESAPQSVRGLLATPPDAPGDLYEQFASRQELVTSGSVMQLVTNMYLDKTTNSLRRGAGANARRLAEVLMQYDVTHDFATIPIERLIKMLPREFRRFTQAQ